MRSTRALCFALCLLGCDSDPTTDAGMPDAGGPPPDAGPPLTCAGAIEVTGVLDGTVSQMVDTSEITTRPRDLGLACGNTSAEVRWAPQSVIRFTVPDAAGPLVVAFTTINEVTPPNFNTVVQARTDCETVPEATFPSTCFDAAQAGREWRSQGAVPVQGGDVVFFIVSGWTEADMRAAGLIDRGPVQIDFTVQANSPPTLTSADMFILDDDLRLDVEGTDPDGNAVLAAVNFYDASGLLDLYGTGAPDELNTLFFIPLDDPMPTGASWTGGSWIRSVAGDMRTQLGEFLVARRANMARVVVVDSLNGASEPRMVPLAEATIVGFGDTCGATARCASGYDCGSANTCVTSAAAVAQCAMATDAALPSFTDQAVSVTVTGQTRVEDGLFDPVAGCVPLAESAGQEAIYQVDVTSVTFDLLLSTDLPVTGRTDTFLYVRTDCGDPLSQLACNDDLAMSDVQSALELRDLAPGSYFVFVEQALAAGAATASHALEITARPVLGVGAACDDAEVLNRCANGPCAASVCP